MSPETKTLIDSLPKMSEEQLFDHLREQVNLSRNGPGHNREFTRALSKEFTRRGIPLQKNLD